MKKIISIYLFTILATVPSVVFAQTVTVHNGNLVFHRADGNATELTHSGRDSEAELSPNGGLIVFVRKYPETPGPWGPGTELRIIHSDGSGDRLLVKDGAASGPNKYMSSFSSPHFLSDGWQIVFHSGWAAVHGSVHVIDSRTGTIRFVSEGNSVCVVTSDQYKDHLIIKMHKYFLAGGSYDFYYLVTLDGNIGAPVSDSENSLADFCEIACEK